MDSWEGNTWSCGSEPWDAVETLDYWECQEYRAYAEVSNREWMGLVQVRDNVGGKWQGRDNDIFRVYRVIMFHRHSILKQGPEGCTVWTSFGAAVKNPGKAMHEAMRVKPKLQWKNAAIWFKGCPCWVLLLIWSHSHPLCYHFTFWWWSCLNCAIIYWKYLI